MKKYLNNKGPYNVTIIYDPPEETISYPRALGSKNLVDKISRVPVWQKAVLFGIVLSLFGIGGAFGWITGIKNSSPDDVVQDTLSKPLNPFEDLSLKAGAALVFDIKKNEIIYAKNEEAQLPLASLTKLITALVAEETLPKEEVVVLGQAAIAEEGDSGLFVGEKWDKNDLIELTLLASSNDGARALSMAVDDFLIRENKNGVDAEELSFSDLMNRRAWSLGMSQTYFLNAAGLDMHKNESGAYGSARDIAILLKYILRNNPRIFDATALTEKTFFSEDGIEHILENTNERIMLIPGLVASKTGFTDLAGGNLAIIFEAGPIYPIAVVVLGSTVDDRFTDVEKLVWATLDYLRNFK